MLKIKGLKKKKKGKKGKNKEDDLFDPEELEQYRKEHQQKLEAGEVSETAQEASSSGEQSEEWRKFQALTAGVDDILKKTQGDLNRIKSSSFFQRKPPGPSEDPREPDKKTEASSKKWTNFQDGSVAAEHVSEGGSNKQTEGKLEQEQTHPVEEEEEEEEDESDQDEDIFDTSYVDVVASGEVKLAYIPESPTEEDSGPDPFDTSIVDQVIKVDPKKKHLVSLGCAVEVLTGRVDKAIPVPEALPTKRKRPKKQDLLLGSFDEQEQTDQPAIVAEEPITKSILDEEPEYIPDEIDLSVNLAPVIPPPSPLIEHKSLSEQENKEKDIPKSIVEEFDVVAQSQQSLIPKIEEDEDVDDEFAALAQESVLKECVKEQTDSTSNNCFNEVIDGNDDVIDPFDTTFAANVLPGKFELKLIEEEILNKEHEFPIKNIPQILEEIPSVRLNDATNEHNFLEDDQTPLSFKHRDLLGGSTTDLSKISDCPIEPAAPKESSEELTYSDPFDTSVVDVLVAPGKTELKFLEKELLDAVIQDFVVDEDFDPRAEAKPTKPPTRPDQLPVGEKRLSLPKVVAFNIQTLQEEQDLLTGNQEENLKVSKPLTPYYADPEEVKNRPSCENVNNLVDPFDTSFVSHAPGKAELKLLESELVVETNLNRRLSDPDFDPRQEVSEAEVDKPQVIVQPPVTLQINNNKPSPERPDFISEDPIITAKLHTPVVPKRIEEELESLSYTDPFDTSIVNEVLPGKAELKLLESEFITSDSGGSIKRSYTDPDFNPRDSPEIKQEVVIESQNIFDHSENINVGEKPLTPQSATSKISFELGDDVDPFDTTCVDNLLPGKAELKVLESELFN